VNKVVARYVDGRTVKGTTVDFFPAKDVFHVIDAAAPAGSPPVLINKQELKALFFVRDLEGDPQRIKDKEAFPTRVAAGRRLQVVFKDGEVLTGTTAGYQPGRPGFFLEPEDASSNVERCYIVTASTREIVTL